METKTQTTTTTTDSLDLKQLLSSVRLNAEVAQPRPMVADNLQQVMEDVSAEERFVSSMAAVVYNMDANAGRFDKQSIQDLIANIDQLVDAQINEVLHTADFQRLESNWTSLNDLVRNTNFKANIGISILDVAKDEAYVDLELNSADISGSELMKKLYVAEYDQYGGKPFGTIIGLYEFENNPQDLLWLKSMGKIATVSHAPFVASVAPKFFGCETMREVG